MSDMLAYTNAVLVGIAEMLQSEPFIYLFGFIVLALTIKAFTILAKF